MNNDARIIGDIVLASILASAVRMLLVETFIKPGLIWLGQRGYRIADWVFGDRLPDIFDKPEAKP